ncbi:MAG: glycosyltransferase, partial [Bacteroidaceae bacterium]|nr:glycosyltransferase [Bacteroidaceae bacterium]
MISVCMASFNGERYIRQQIDSILQQLGDGDELVISDDGSCDATADIIRSYADRRLRFFCNPGPHGVTHNFQHALRQAQGDILFLADQDDVWLPGKIERQVRFLVEGGYDVVSCNCALTDAE